MRIVVLFLFTFICGNGVAQQFSQSTIQSGIYPAYANYEDQEPSHAFKAFEPGFSIWPSGFFRYKDVVFKSPESNVVFQTDDIWGYTDHTGRLIRVQNKLHYQVLCNKGLIIYIIHSPIKISYHFSTSLESEILKLTRNNLQHVYANNKRWIARINSTRKAHWLMWDKEKQMFFLNKLFQDKPIKKLRSSESDRDMDT